MVQQMAIDAKTRKLIVCVLPPFPNERNNLPDRTQVRRSSPFGDGSLI